MGVWHAHGTSTYRQTNIHTHKIKYIIFKLPIFHTDNWYILLAYLEENLISSKKDRLDMSYSACLVYTRSFVYFQIQKGKNCSKISVLLLTMFVTGANMT